MTQNDILELKEIEKDLDKTKFWDLRIFGVGTKLKNFKFEFINRNNNQLIIHNSIHPYNKKDNTIYAYTVIGNGINKIEELKFESAKRADEIFDSYQQSVKIATEKHWLLTPIENLRNRVQQIKMLDEAYQNMQNISNNTKIIDTISHEKHNVGNQV